MDEITSQSSWESNAAIHDLLRIWADRTPENIAIAAPGRVSLPYSLLLSHAKHVVKTLNEVGVGCNDRVGLLVLNGPEMATSFLAVAAGATPVPLNPTYRSNEYEAYLREVGPRAIIVQSDLKALVAPVAETLGIPIIELIPRLGEAAGLFDLAKGHVRGCCGRSGLARPEDIALVLGTSGTTSRSKIVALTNANLCLSAANIAKGFGLSPRDRCLNLMPLFHIHGLIGGLLASVTAGAGVFCAPGPHAPQFIGWLQESGATWYTAAPTIHQAIAARSQSSGGVQSCKTLRFIRSCSSPLAPKLLAELEAIFQVPVIESYGMTEASHQIASNPLPPRRHKPGSVGLPTGVELAIVDAAGNRLKTDEIGEVAVRGLTVTAGYENNPEANKLAFRDGWFRTGDQGYFDSEGYLFLTGRLKELINRGAVKIAPREIDEALLDHPAVAQAVAFAVPHPRLGEDVAAAVVLRKSCSTTEREIKEFAAQRLAPFKVPRRIVFVDEIPKGPTGKLQRGGLAEKLGLAQGAQTLLPAKTEFVAPRTPIEEKLARIWAEVLALPSIGVNDNFFDMGGDSLMAVQLLSRVSETMRVEFDLSLIHFVEAPTVANQAQILVEGQSRRPKAALVPLQPSGAGGPLFCVPPGTHLRHFRELAGLLGPDRPIYGLQCYDLVKHGVRYSIETAASQYLREIRSVQSEGPYLIASYCAGSSVALELANQLAAQGQKVAFLGLIYPVPVPERFFDHSLRSHWQHLTTLRPAEKISYIFSKLGLLFHKTWRHIRYRIPMARMTYRVSQRSLAAPEPQVGEEIRQFNRGSWRRSLRRPYLGRIDIFVTESSLIPNVRSDVDPRTVYDKVARGGLNVHIVPGDHDSILRQPLVLALAEQMRCCLDRANERTERSVSPTQNFQPKELTEEPQVIVTTRSGDSEVPGR